VFWAAAGIVAAAHFAFVPLELLAVLAGTLLGTALGGSVALVGGWLGAVLGYVIGRAVRPKQLAALMSRRAYRSTRQLGARGGMGVAVLRLTSIASALSVHLVCGATRVPVGAYLVGSAIGLAPAMFVLAWVGSLVGAAILDPGWLNALAAAGGVLAVSVLAFGVRALLVARQFSPTMRSHRRQAEFG
jgi:uncharacterized membrane protein YdjX (TVP38/TMEM64 family)